MKSLLITRSRTMIMKLLLVLLTIGTFASATEIHFQLDPFSGAALNTSPGKEHVRLFNGGKFSETVLLDSKLKNTGKNQLSSPGGTIFTYKKLPKPEVRAAGRRHEFTATWTVTLSGKGKGWFAEMIPVMTTTVLRSRRRLRPSWRVGRW